MKKLKEAGITLGKNGKAYPNYGNILILAGGTGSGKSFITKNVLLFDGKTFNIDDLKEQFIQLAQKNPNCKFAQKFKAETGYDLANLNFKDGDQLTALHQFIYNLKVGLKQQMLFFLAQRPSKTKANVIFDMTFKDIQRLEQVANYAEQGGYDKKNLHIVWVLTEINEARSNNALRKRSEPDDVIVKSHEGAAMTMFELMNNFKSYEQYMDGDIWIVFNRRGIDSRVTFTKSKGLSGKEDNTITHIDTNPSLHKDYGKLTRGYLAVKVKEAGKPSKSFEEINEFFKEKVLSYIPKK